MIYSPSFFPPFWSRTWSCPGRRPAFNHAWKLRPKFTTEVRIRQSRNLYQMKALRTYVLRKTGGIISITVVWNRDQKMPLSCWKPYAVKILSKVVQFHRRCLSQSIYSFKWKTLLSGIFQPFADLANSAFAFHGNYIEYASTMYSDGITQFIYLLHPLFIFGLIPM